jgi:hypothetical protein
MAGADGDPRAHARGPDDHPVTTDAASCHTDAVVRELTPDADAASKAPARDAHPDAHAFRALTFQSHFDRRVRRSRGLVEAA